MTGKSDKVRGVFLTALMVFSVFAGTVAFTGSAAAVSDAVRAPNDPVEFESSTTGQNHIEIIFNESVTASNYNFEVINRSGGVVNSSATIAGSPTTSGSRVVLNLGPNDLQGNGTLNVSSTSTSFQRNFSITPTSTTVEQGGPANVNLYKGELVAVLDLGQANRDYEVLQGDNDQFLFGGSTGTNSLVAVENTSQISEISAGNEYNVSFLDSTGSEVDRVTANVRNLGLSVEIDDTSLSFTGDSSTTINGTVSSNAPGREVLVTLLDSDDDDVEETTVTIDGDREVDFDFDVSDDDNYTVEVEDIATGITDTSENIVVSEVSGSASFAQSVTSEERGDVARITVELQNRDTASVVIGGEDVNYLQEVLVEDGADGDEDGQVTILFNTFAPSSSGSFTANDEDDSVTLNSTSLAINVGSPLAATSYEMNITDGGVRSADGDLNVDELAVGTLSLRERATTNFRSWTAASGEASSLDEPEAIAGYAEAGNLTRDSTIAEGDAIALQLQASGIYGAINATNDDNATDAVVQLNNAGAINFSIYESQATIAPNADGAQFLDPNQINHDIVVDGPNNNLYVVLESEALIGGDAEVGDRFVANFTLPKSSQLTPKNERQSVTSEFRVVERSLDFDTDAQLADGTDIITVEAAEGQNVTGTTSRAPGTEIGISARATGDAPFLLSQDVNVQSDGTFTATFDFSNISAGQNFTVDASGSYDEDPETDGRVQAAATASVTFNDQTSNGEEVTVASVSLSEGGFVTIHDSTLQDGATFDSVRGTSDYLESGSSSSVTVTLDDPISESQTLIAMPHQDTNDNEAYDFVSSNGASDGPYTSGGAAVTDSASITVEMATETPEPTPTATPEPTPTATPEPTPTATAVPTTEDPSTPEPTTTGDGPGFGVVLALIALIGAALLAVRRND